VKVRDFEVRSYEDAQRLLGDRRCRKVCNNTILRRYGECIRVYLHGQVIVQWTPTAVYLYSGDYRMATTTATTKDRINRCIPQEFHLYQQEGTWCVEELDLSGGSVLFEEGMDLLTAFDF
jgi:hypothetical protein